MYFCTSKASKLASGTTRVMAAAASGRLSRQPLPVLAFVSWMSVLAAPAPTSLPFLIPVHSKLNLY